MEKTEDNGLNFFDFFGFPDRQQRNESLNVFDVEKLRLIEDENGLWGLNDFLKKYNIWVYCIHNLSSQLWIHFLLMYYHYQCNPLEIFNMGPLEIPEAIHKIYFDSFAEDTSLYLISYFDKHLEMFSELYDLNKKSNAKRSFGRGRILNEMKKNNELKDIYSIYSNTALSPEFKYVKEIRDNFVHNKPSSYSGLKVEVINNCGVEQVREYNSEGISTQETYDAICKLVKKYEDLCVSTNRFFTKEIQKAISRI